MKQFILMLIFWVGIYTPNANAQSHEERVLINGDPVLMIVEDGDTMYVADLPDADISSVAFKNKAEKRHDNYLRKNAKKVYPYAKDLMKAYRHYEEVLEDKRSRKKKKYIKQVQKDIETKFDKPILKLTKTQGKILIKMIERETGQPCKKILRDIKGRFASFYWSKLARTVGYDLESGYKSSDDPLLEEVLKEFPLDEAEIGTYTKK